MAPQQPPVPGGPLWPASKMVQPQAPARIDPRKTVSYEDAPLPPLRRASAESAVSAAEVSTAATLLAEAGLEAVSPPAAGDEASAVAETVLAMGSMDSAVAATMLAKAADGGRLVSTGPTLGEGQPVRTSGATVEPRTTVLPRIEVIGEEARLASELRPRYEPQGELGRGGVGEVIRARDNDIERVVAVKKLRPDMLHDAVVARFVDEIRTIGLLEHPNIVPIHDVGVDERGEYFFVMKYVEGETLEAIIDKLAAGNAAYHRRYPFERRVEIFQKILEAIEFAHSRGVIHRDIKPANVMVGSYGEVVVMDWGLAKKIRDDGVSTDLLRMPAGLREKPAAVGGERSVRTLQTRVGSIMGTPAYMAPEQARGQAADERSDVYALCVLFHELLGLEHYLAHKTTVEGVLQGVQAESFKFSALVRRRGIQPPVPAELAWFVEKGLRKNPEDRYGSVLDMIVRLGQRREGVIPIQCHLTAMKRFTGMWTRSLDRHPLLVTVIVGLAVLSSIGMAVRLALL